MLSFFGIRTHTCFDYQINFYRWIIHLWLYSLGKLSSSANVVNMRRLSRPGLQKVGSDNRCFRVHALFGGKKDNNDAPSKVSQSSLYFSLMLYVNTHTGWWQFCICICISYLFAFFFFSHHSHKWPLLRTVIFFFGVCIWWKCYRFYFPTCLIFISLSQSLLCP